MSLVGAPAVGQAPPRPADLTVSTGGTTFYNLPGATWADHTAAMRECAAVAGNAIYAWGSGETLPEIESIMASHPSFQGFMENCMVLKGWRVVQMNPWKARPYARSGRATLEGVLTPLIGAESPEGEIKRVFSNEAARSDTVFNRYLVTPTPPRTLSIRATDLNNLPRFWAIPDVPPAPSAALPAYRPYHEPLAAGDLARLPPDAAVIIFRVIGSGQSPGGGFTLRRMAPQAELTARRSSVLEPTDTAFVGPTPQVVRRPEDERGDVVMAFPVVPGRYRIADRMMLDLCFGAPAFEIAAGQILYLGAFEIAGQASLSPEMTLEPAQALLASTPALQERLRPASWVNGLTEPCRGGSAYALEFPGLPFEDGYVRGMMPALPADYGTRVGAATGDE